MKLAARLTALLVIAFLAACQRSPVSVPVPSDANAKVVVAFLTAYGRRDLDGMMRYLDEDAIFRGSGGSLPKPKIRDFFQSTFRKYPNLRVEVASVQVVQGTIHAAVKVETDVIWSDTWIFEMKNHKIRAYSLASGQR
ncbi:nuclear transport factor 2 family protein [Geothrix fuzhouensis]|uniref:nuclear transport factor 2 family protein n=1 Tax=Geothrix fuzhouensis TaxID=2966451 RepID=UPI0021474D0A|nr:nuclear transport factor 2 family protein [Geothrix fuzhouensis]